MISRLVRKRPMKLILFSLALVALFVFGVQQIQLATGNDTFIERESDVFQDNLALETEFGGESLIVLYEADNLDKLLTVTNLEHMKGLEARLTMQDEVFTVMSPVSIVEQIVTKQSEKYEEGIGEIIEGLETMEDKLQEIGDNLEKNSSSNQLALPDLDTKMAELNRGMQQMITGQTKLQAGTTSLVQGYAQFGNQTKQVAGQLITLSEQHEEQTANPVQIQQFQKLKQTGNQLMMLSDKMFETSTKSTSLPQVSNQTIKGLQKMQGGFGSEKAKMNDLKQQQADQMKNLQELAEGLTSMGDNLMTISENLSTMVQSSDVMVPSLPQKQDTLEQMVYEDNGDLRSIFNEMIIDRQYMTLIVKLKGDVSDTKKSKIVAEVKEYLASHTLEETKTMVSGKPVLDDAIRSSMKQSMQKMMGLAMLFMVVVLSVVFRVKWRILPLTMILVAVIGTVGLMGWLSIPITMVSMAVFPILIGLGIDYGIQFQSRYVEEMEKGEVQHEE